MDIRALATAAVALLIPYLAKVGEAFSEKAGERLAEKAGELYLAVKRKFEGDDYAEQTLARFKKKPESEGRQVALGELLAKKMEGDAGFASVICQLVQDTTEVSGGDAINQRLEISGKTGDVFQVGKVTGGFTKVESEGNIVGDDSSPHVRKETD